MLSNALGVSSQTRRKLKAFEYHEQQDTMDTTDAGKENTGPGMDVKMDEREKKATKTQSITSPSRRAPSQNCPQTPANRIPLADLIGNVEEAFNRPAQDITPDDHVLWQTGPRSSDPASSIPSQQRGKKRAHSSSPARSQSEKSKNYGPNNIDTPLNLRNLQHLLKTPQTDPALDLWNRYAEVGAAKQDGAIHATSFTNLASSSPQTPGTTSGKKGLQKAMSCGIEWPVSRAKKAKLDHSHSLQQAEHALAQSKAGVLSSKTSATSKVNLLMEKIQEGMIVKTSPARLKHPSSSSPFPNRISVFGDDQALPSFPVIKESHSPQLPLANPQSTTRVSPESPRAANQIEAPAQLLADGSSDYGEDVFDDEFDEAPLEAPVGEVVTEAVLLRDESNDDDNYDADDFEDLVADIEADDVLPAPGRAVPEEATVKAAATGNIESNEFDEDDDVEDEELWNALSGSMTATNAQVLATKTVPNTSQVLKRTNRQAIKRYMIVDVADSHYEDDRGRARPEKVLSVKDEKTREMKVILLRQCWLDTRTSKGAFVHLIGDFDRIGQCTVDDSKNLIITHPDILISATGVSDSFQCLRRSVLADRIRATSDPNPAQVYGSLLHEVFQEALRANCWDSEWLDSIIERIVEESIEALYQINVKIPDATEYMKSKMPELRAWADLFISAEPQATAFAQERNGVQVNVGINKLLEVEEHVWSPMYGLKGNIDATVQVMVNKDGLGSQARTLTVPLELKTGKRDTSESHRAQTALYTLLLQDRYDVNVMFGLLYYIETSKVFSVPAIRNEIRHMIVQRNELASFVHSKLDLPPMSKKPHMCNSCYAKVPCWTYHRLMEDGDGESSGLAGNFDAAMAHLTSAHQTWFKKWDDLITKEEKDMMKFRRELWTMTSSERQKVGRCFGGVIIDPGSAQVNQNRAKIDRYRYTFIKKTAESGFSFTESQLTVGEPIVISDEEGHFALAMGYITNVSSKRLSVAVDRRLHNVRTKGTKFNAENNQAFRGIMEVGLESTQTSAAEEQAILYRIDKDEFNSGLATIRNNLVKMMEKDLFRAKELRQLIINGVPPTFKMTSTAYTLKESASQHLNVDQRKAIEKVMSAQDYALVLGMPGTGKTTTIAHIIRALVLQGKTVLLNSYTHTAVDNILLKIKDDNIKVLRIGSLGKIHADVQAFADLAAVPKKTVAELEDSYVNSQVVATTCLGVNHPIFNQRVFDYCIVDEASQITLPTCLSGLRMAKTFVLVGDHYQLPPLVQNKEAQEGGLDISLFKLLSDQHPDSVVSLEHQYRMNADIMLLSNHLIYTGRLKCGTQMVAERMLHLPDLESGLNAHHGTPDIYSSRDHQTCHNGSTCWLRCCLSPERKVIFLNTDRMGPAATEITQGPRITNVSEAILSSQLVQTLVSSGIAPRDIGVITCYRSQLALLRQELGPRYSEVEMHTADKFQGRDKEVIILSCVRHNDSGNIGDLLKDWRRVNVALTRARSKLLVVGSRGTLARSENDVLEGFVELLEEKGWIYDLPVDATEGHVFEAGGRGMSQGTGTAPPPPPPVMSRNSPAASPSKKKVKTPTKVPPPPFLRDSQPKFRVPWKKQESTKPTKPSGEENRNEQDIDVTMKDMKDTTTKTKLRQPNKLGKGMDMEKLLDKNALLRDVAMDYEG